eukprot:1911934-Pyramimonas_sp.AAC.1
MGRGDDDERGSATNPASGVSLASAARGIGGSRAIAARGGRSWGEANGFIRVYCEVALITLCGAFGHLPLELA